MQESCEVATADKNAAVKRALDLLATMHRNGGTPVSVCSGGTCGIKIFIVSDPQIGRAIEAIL